MKRILLAVALVALAALSAACASTGGSTPPAPSGPVVDGPTIVAKDLKFQTTSVEVKAGSNVTIHFDNQDSAPHNVAVYTDSSASSAPAVGEIVTSAKSELVVPALQPGSYFFRCDVHHDMTGTIVAK
ncbi:MAG TPA: cupredoxin domain-containing protein [Candidatus Limnocylindrales bacterium]|nr:cupredoxin domain-containing protein [Candidatus Limnocylindrales bacterium]